MKCHKPIYCDVDDTLLMWNIPDNKYPSHKWVTVEYEGFSQKLVVNTEVVEALKKHKARGSTVIVWSLAGSGWAEAAVKALGLEEYVDLTLEKPWILYDDLDPGEFLPNPKWFPVPGCKE